MAKTGVEYEEVARAADALLAKGVEPTVRLVLAEVGGSATTVHKHMKAWRAAHPQAAAAPPELPASLQRAIQEELRRQQAEARADIEARLSIVQVEAGDLARAAEKAETEAEDLRQQLAEQTQERDRLSGQLEQQSAEMAKLQNLLQGERAAAEAARVDLAQARLKAAGDAELVETMKTERSALRGDIEKERAGRIDAERQHAAATAARDKLQDRVDELVSRTAALDKMRIDLQAGLDAERTQRTDAQRDLAAATARAKATEERAEDLQRREEALRKELTAARPSAEKSPKPSES